MKSGLIDHFNGASIEKFNPRSEVSNAKPDETGIPAGTTVPCIIRLAGFRRWTGRACEELFAELANGAEAGDDLDEERLNLAEGICAEQERILTTLTRALGRKLGSLAPA